jgi:parallel beta-helix repeat protein
MPTETILTADQIEDLRYNPFTNVWSSVLKSERRLIPSTPPYIIKLFEIPEEQAPSVTQIIVVSTSQTLIEDSKTTEPINGHYRVNYDELDIGKIEFNAAQKSEYVDIQYYGRGSIYQKKVALIKLNGINTRLVASSDSDTQSQNVADSVILTGDDAGARLNTIIDEVNALGGGTIMVFEGNYNFSTTCNLKSNVNIIGQGYSTIFNQNAAINYILRINIQSNIKIQNLQIDGKKASYAAGRGIKVESGSDQITIEGCYIHDCKSENIEHAGTNSLIINNFIYDSDGRGITTSGQRMLISNNHCYSNTNGIDFSGAYTTCVSNICNNNSQANIDCRGDHATITGNNCANSSTQGIDLSSVANHCIVSGNICYSNTQYGIRIGDSNNTITGNTCFQNTFGGIYILTANNNTITGNTCYDNGTNGIRIATGNNHTITGNTCHDNTEDGIQLSNCDQNVISGNNCYNNGALGIDVDDSDDNSICSNALVGNTTNAIDFDATSDTNIAQNNKTVVGNGASAIADNGTNNSVQATY